MIPTFLELMVLEDGNVEDAESKQKWLLMHVVGATKET